jgi:hypothetical protein
MKEAESIKSILQAQQNIKDGGDDSGSSSERSHCAIS